MCEAAHPHAGPPCTSPPGSNTYCPRCTSCIVHPSRPRTRPHAGPSCTSPPGSYTNSASCRLCTLPLPTTHLQGAARCHTRPDFNRPEPPKINTQGSSPPNTATSKEGGPPNWIQLDTRIPARARNLKAILDPNPTLNPRQTSPDEASVLCTCISARTLDF